MKIKVRTARGMTFEQSVAAPYTLARLVEGIDTALDRQAKMVIKLAEPDEQLLINPQDVAVMSVLEA